MKNYRRLGGDWLLGVGSGGQFDFRLSIKWQGLSATKTHCLFAAVVSQGINEWRLHWLYIILIFYSEIEDSD